MAEPNGDRHHLERACGLIPFGVAGVLVGVALLASATTAFAIVLEGQLVPAGVGLAVSGALGRCRLYSKLGQVPFSLRRSA